jgi:ABC-2 type transport system permease protein
VSPAHALVLLLGTLALYLLPLLGIAGFGILTSTITRNSAAAVVSTLMFALLTQLMGALPGTEAIRPYLLSDQFLAWHGLLRVPIDSAPIVRALWVSALYLTLPPASAYLIFLRRDVAGD